MCFSAPASFVAGVTLSAVGGVTLSKAKSMREIPLASFPLLFGIQQAIEGVVWISFGWTMVNTIATHAFLTFAYVLWPILVPVAVLLVEPHPTRRNILKLFLLIGLLIGLYLLYFMIIEPSNAHIVNKSIAYDFRHVYDLVYVTPYVVVTALSGFVSSHRMLKLFGVALLIAFFVSWYFYSVNFISVWCFFAAVLSVIILIHFIYLNKQAVVR